MAIYFSIDGGEPSPLASNEGWSDLCRWIDSLPDGHEPLRHLREHGWYEPSDELADDILAAGNDSPPSDPHVQQSVKDLYEAALGNGPDAVITINDGTSSSEGGAAPEAATFSDVGTDDEVDPPDAPIAGPDARAAINLTQEAMARGRAVLADITTDAIKRRLNGATGPFFNAQEAESLADAIAATNATAELLGRYRVREKAQPKAVERFAAFAEGPTPGKIKPIPPAQALKFFRELMPSISPVPDFVERMRRTSFTLAVNTSDVILRQIQDAIAASIAEGKTGTAAVQSLLDKAGVSDTNPGYADMVFRTNATDALNTGFDDERQAPDVIDEFPVWRYRGIRDGRQGKDHEPKFDKYYPATASFAEVRGDRPFSCRCSQEAVSRREWARLQSQGAKVETTW